MCLCNPLCAEPSSHHPSFLRRPFDLPEGGHILMTTSVITYFKVINGGPSTNRFAHKHVGQLTNCAARPKHENMQEGKNSTFCRNYSLPSFFMFFLCSPSSLPLPLLCIPVLFCISRPPPALYLTTFNTTPTPSFIFVFLSFSPHIIPALPSLPDIVA